MRIRVDDISLGVLLLLGTVPVVAAFIYALLYSVGLIGIANDGFSWDFYKTVVQEGNLIESMWYSTLVSAVALCLSVGLALWYAVHFHSTFKQRTLSMIAYLPLCIPGIVASFFGTQILSKAGFLSRVSYTLGFTNSVGQFPDLINDAWSIGIVLTFVSVVMPFLLILFLSVYEQEKVSDLIILAISLGAHASQARWKVAVPILLYKTRVLIALYFIFLLGAYEIPLILGIESPQMLSVLIVRDLKQFDLTKISEGYAIAVIYSLVIGLMTYLIIRRFNKDSI